MSNKPRRDPVPESAKYYLRNAHRTEEGLANRLFSMREAFNHLENAAYAEAEARDRLKERVERLEAALKEIVDLYPEEYAASEIARTALDGKESTV